MKTQETDINDSIQMIRIYIEMFELGEQTSYQLVESIKEHLTKISTKLKNCV